MDALAVQHVCYEPKITMTEMLLQLHESVVRIFEFRIAALAMAE